MSDAQTVGQAVEQVSAPKMISPGTFAQVLPQHLGAEKFTRWALTLLRKPELAAVAATDAGRLSIMSALMDCASLGLEPGRTYHLVLFGGREKDGTPKPHDLAGGAAPGDRVTGVFQGLVCHDRRQHPAPS